MDISVQDLFTKGRTCHDFTSDPVPQELLEEIYNITKFGPTSANGSPLRIKFVSSDSAKQKLIECVMEGNIAGIKKAPITAIFAHDLKFYEKMDILFPHNPGIKGFFSSSEKTAEETAFRNSTLQAAYFMVVARSKGLGLGPMSGFDTAKLDAAFFANQSIRSNFICTIGYPTSDIKYERLPRLDFQSVCEIV
jgi:nitroreductase